MPKKMTYTEVANSLVQGGWHWETDAGVNTHIKGLTDTQKMVVLLADIAQSLRPLRCSNFTDIPRRLDRTRVAIEGLRRESKARARARRRRL